MREFVGTTLAAIGGAARRLAALLAVAALLALAPHLATSVANTGGLDVGSLAPPASTGTASAAAVRVDGGTPTERESVRRALGDLRWPVDSSTLRLVVDDGTELPSEAVGMHVYPANVIYVRNTVADDPRRRGLARVLAHELGHATDFTSLDAAGRSEFLAARGYDADAEWRPAAATWESSPAEDFAEVFAVLDAPSSTAPIATRAGRIRDPAAMRALVARYQPGARPDALPVGAAAIVSVARELTADARTDDVVAAWLVFLAILAVATGALDAIGPYSKRAARAARQAVHS